MSIERSYDVITLPKGRKIVKIKFDDPYYELLGTFFFSDYRSFGDWIDEKIDIVVNGEEEMQDISGNICEMICWQMMEKENGVNYRHLNLSKS